MVFLVIVICSRRNLMNMISFKRAMTAITVLCRLLFVIQRGGGKF